MCINSRRYVCYNECDIVSNECNEPTSCLVQPIGAHCGEVMYFGWFGFRGELGFLNYVATDTIAFPTQTSPPPLTMPYNVAASSKTPDITSAVLDQMKELKSQMIQMQQTQNFLLKNIMSQAWPPLPAQKVAQFPSQMF